MIPPDRLTAILDSANIGLWHLHVPSGKTIRNRVLRRMMHASAEELDDLGAWEHRIHPADREEILHKRQRLLAGELDAYWVDYRVRYSSGRWGSVRARVTVTERDAAGQPLWLSGVILDTSGERELERRLHAIFDRPFQFVGLLTPEGLLLETNRSSLRDSGHKLEEVLGKPLWEGPLYAHSPALQAQLKDGVARAARGELIRFEMCNPDKDGVSRAVDFTLTPLRDDDSVIVNIISEGRDITDLATAREAVHIAERRLHNATEAASTGLWEFAIDTAELWVSDQWRRLLGFQAGAGPTKATELSAIVHPDDRLLVNEEMMKYFRNEIPEYCVELRMRHSDGAWRWFLSKARAIERDATGKVRRFAGILMDITEQHNVAERLALATEGANIGHWDIHVLIGKIWVSDQWGSMLGYGAGELPTTIEAFFALVHPDDYPRALQLARELHAAAKPATFDHEYRMRAKDGSWRWIHTKGRSVEFAPDGQVRRQTGVTMDVTERKAAESRLVTSERLESIGRLAAGVAHEINTPIQYVNDSLYFIREGMQELLAYFNQSAHAAEGASARDFDLPYLKENLPGALDRAIDGLARVTEIVRSMKEFSHQDQTSMHAVDLNRAIQSTLVVAKSEYKFVADLTTEFGELPAVTCHGSQINQVILNLVVNAAHAIADRVTDTQQRGLITVKTYTHDREVVICVGDTGTGIPEAVRDRIFEPFFTTKDVGQGTGQGLSIARNVVHGHGGSIHFQTELNKGTTFFVRLPIDRTDHRTDSVAA